MLKLPRSTLPCTQRWSDMRQGLKGNLLPESQEEFEALLGMGVEALKHTECLVCRQTFSNANTSSKLGWADTQIVGYCESCYDKIFQTDEEGE